MAHSGWYFFPFSSSKSINFYPQKDFRFIIGSNINARANGARSVMTHTRLKIIVQNINTAKRYVDIIWKGWDGSEAGFDFQIKPLEFKQVDTFQGHTYIARDSQTKELLYFIDEKNGYDVMFRVKKNNEVVSVASLKGTFFHVFHCLRPDLFQRSTFV